MSQSPERHAVDVHGPMAGSVEASEVKVGVDGSLVPSTLDYQVSRAMRLAGSVAGPEPTTSTTSSSFVVLGAGDARQPLLMAKMEWSATWLVVMAEIAWWVDGGYSEATFGFRFDGQQDVTAGVRAKNTSTDANRSRFSAAIFGLTPGLHRVEVLWLRSAGATTLKTDATYRYRMAAWECGGPVSSALAGGVAVG